MLHSTLLACLGLSVVYVWIKLCCELTSLFEPDLALFAPNASSAMATELQLWVGVHKDMVQQVQAKQCIPSNATGRDWLSLHDDPATAADRAAWFPCTCAVMKADVVLVKVKFTCAGIGYYVMTNLMSNYGHGHWRFYGDMPFSAQHPTTGELLLLVDLDLMEIE